MRIFNRCCDLWTWYCVSRNITQHIYIDSRHVMVGKWLPHREFAKHSFDHSIIYPLSWLVNELIVVVWHLFEVNDTFTMIAHHMCVGQLHPTYEYDALASIHTICVRKLCCCSVNGSDFSLYFMRIYIDAMHRPYHTTHHCCYCRP